jgi:hypothetical protein
VKAFALKQSLVNLLSAASEGRYNVLGVQNRKTDAEDVRLIPQVTIAYTQGSFPEASSSINGPYQHEITLEIRVLAGAVAGVNLEVLKDKDATDEERAEALAASGNAAVKADALAEETVSLLFDVIMRPQNRKLGAEENAGRWVTGIRKGDPLNQGAIVLVPAVITLTAQTTEFTTEEEGVPGTEGIRHTADISADASGEVPAEQGVQVFAPKGEE